MNDLEGHYLAGGNVQRVVNALISADKAGIALTYKQATAIDLAGRDVFEAVQVSVNPKVITTPKVAAMAKDGIQLLALARVTVRANINRLVGGAGEETILARVGEGIVSTIGSAVSHKAVLENPDLISKTVLAKGLDAGTAFEILSIDIADVDVGKNIGAELQTDQAEADKRIAQAKAEERRALAVAIEQEFKAEAQNQRAKVIAAEAQIPLAIAEAFRSGNLGVMDYQRYRNIQADTTMRTAIAGGGDSAPTTGRLSGGSRSGAAHRVRVAGDQRHPQGGEQAAGTGAPPRRPPGTAQRLRSNARAPGRAAASGRAAQAAPAGQRRRRDPAGGQPARGASPGAGPHARAGARGPWAGRPTGACRRPRRSEERESLEVAPGGAESRARSASGRRGSRSIRTTRPSGSWRGGSRPPRRRASRSRRRTIGRSTSGFGRRRRTRPRPGATRRASCGMRWCGGRFSGRRCRCGGREERGRASALAAAVDRLRRTSSRTPPSTVTIASPRRRRALESPRLRPRSLEILVHLKEVLDLLEVVRRDVTQIVEPVGVRDRPSAPRAPSRRPRRGPPGGTARSGARSPGSR